MFEKDEQSDPNRFENAYGANLATPRGLEAYVPALARLRMEYWGVFSPQLRALLEIADYVGLERAINLTIEEFEGLWSTLPGFLWRRSAEVLATEQRDPALPLFTDERGAAISTRSALAQLARAVALSS